LIRVDLRPTLLLPVRADTDQEQELFDADKSGQDRIKQKPGHARTILCVCGLLIRLDPR
jgi:hypothetical protein